MSRRIDSIKEINLETVTAEDLRWKYGTYTSKSKGKGRDKVTTSRSGIMTPIGDIELSIWVEAARSVVHRDGLDEELNHMTGYYLKDESPAFPKKDLVNEALSAVLSGLYKDQAWVGFIKYNQKYHPDLLAAANLVEVYSTCCGAPCTFTKAWLERGDKYATCPQCGEWGTIRRTKEALPAEEEG